MRGRGFKATSALAAISAVLLVVPVMAPAATGRVTGSIKLHGCAPSYTTLQVTATDITGLQGGDPQPAPRRALIHVGEGAHQFFFEFEGLAADRVFAIVPRIDEAVCGRMLWESDGGLLAIPDRSPELTVRGYAMRTKLGIRNERSSSGPGAWLGADLARKADGGTSRVFRWWSDLSPSGFLQFATEPFPLTDPCADPPGLFHSTPVAGLQSSWNETAIELNTIYDKIPAQRKKIVDKGAGIYARVVPVASSGTGRECDPVILGISSKVTISFLKSLSPKFSGPTQPLLMPTLNYGTPVGSEATRYGPPFINQNNPDQYEVCYQATKLHFVNAAWNDPSDPAPAHGDIVAKASGYKHGDLIPKGKVFCHVWYPSSGSSGGGFLDLISDVVSEAVDGVAWLVNKAAGLYDGVKKFVVEKVVAALDWVGNEIFHYDFCDAPCEQLVQYAVEYGMAMMGLPPSLPNFDQLTTMGTEYLKMQISEQTGVPPEVVNAAAKIAERSVVEMQANRGSQQTGFMSIPWATEYDGLHPGALLLKIRHINLMRPLPDILAIHSDGPLYQDAFVPLPRQTPRVVPPEPFLTIPVVLLPNFDELDEEIPVVNGMSPMYQNALFNVYYKLKIILRSCFYEGGTRFFVNAGELLNANTIQLQYVDADWTVDSPDPSAWWGPKHSDCVP